MTKLTINIPEDVEKQLLGFCEKEHCSFEEAIFEILRRQFHLKQFRQLNEESKTLSQKAGYDSEDDLIRDIS